MKHTIARAVAILIWMCLFAYVGRLFFQGYHVALVDAKTANMTVLLLSGLVALFLLVVVFFPTVLPINRWMVALVWACVIVFADIYLQDEPSRMVYLQDIMKLVGVFMVIVGPMKLLYNQKIQEKIEEKNIEIIEV